MKFRDLAIGQTFDWIDDAHRHRVSFWKRCTKISARRYRDDQHIYQVGKIGAEVFHVEPIHLDRSKVKERF